MGAAACQTAKVRTYTVVVEVVNGIQQICTYDHVYTTTITAITQCKLQYVPIHQCSKEKHCQHKLQRVMTTMSASGVFAMVDGKKTTTSASCRGSRPSWAQAGVGCNDQMQLAEGQEQRSCALCKGIAGVSTFQVGEVSLNNRMQY